MWKLKYLMNKIKRRFENPSGWDWFNLAIMILNAVFFYNALLTGNMLGLLINGFFFYIGFKNLTQ